MKFTKTQLYIGAAIAVVAIWAYYKGYFAGPDKGYNVDPGTAPDGTTPTSAPADPRYKNLARNFRNSMLNNSTSSQIFIDACDSLLELSDADLISVNNAYNNLYRNEEYKTISSVLMQEWVWPSWFFLYLYQDETEKKQNELLKRLQSLGL